MRTAFFILLTSCFLLLAPSAHAKTAKDLQAKIDQRTSDIQTLEKEIASYQKQINDLSGQESTLSANIQSLDLTQKKLAADIAVTEDKIDATNLRIRQLSSQIGATQNTIDDDRRFVAASFKSINEEGSRSIPEIFLSSQTISGAWNAINELAKLQKNLESRVASLNSTKIDLEKNERATEQAKADLIALQNQLKDQQGVVKATQADKNRLLAQTKDSEASYQQLLARKKAEEAAFQEEINQYQSQLRLIVNPGELPATGQAVLSWPLNQVFITQYFGNTPFATANPQIYNGHGHDGIDLRALVGTPIKAALSGTVTGEANTDLIPGCYSFGKWIMLKHDNGLSTLYAHLSLQTAAMGDRVSTGQIIGYSGNTGYTTGPHLHFGVYATQGMEIKQFTNSLHCAGAVIPIAVLSAYLNPLSYLPSP